MIEDAPEADIVLVQVGGGGLISGIATAVKGMKPEARVVAVLTGHMLKDPEILLSTAGATAILEVDPTPEALARVVEGTASE